MSSHNNGGTTEYYAVPKNAKTLNDLIDTVRMSWNIANIFKACYRFGRKDNASKIYDLNKIIYYANRELNLVQQEEASKEIIKAANDTATIKHPWID